MKRILALLLGMSCLTACIRDESKFIISEDCEVQEEVIAPEGLTINAIGSITTGYPIMPITFVNSEVGYIFSQGFFETDPIVIYKTVDGDKLGIGKNLFYPKNIITFNLLQSKV